MRAPNVWPISSMEYPVLECLVCLAQHLTVGLNFPDKKSNSTRQKDRISKFVSDQESSVCVGPGLVAGTPRNLG